MPEIFKNLPATVAEEISRVPTFADLPTGVEPSTVRYVDADETTYQFNGVSWETMGGGVSGPVPGAGSTDVDAVVRWATTDGDEIKNSPVLIDDSGNVSGVGDIDAVGTISGNAFEAGGYDGTEKALYSTSAKIVEQSATTRTELEYLSGVTSAVQTQLDAKLDDIGTSTDNAVVRWSGAGGDLVESSVVIIDDSGNVAGVADLTASGDIVGDALGLDAYTGNRAAYIDGTGFLTEATTTATELDYVSGVTGAIQTQLDDKVNGAGTVTTEAVVVFDGTAGVDVKETPVTINASGDIGGAQSLTLSSYLISDTGSFETSVEVHTFAGDFALVSDSSTQIVESAVTATELGYLSGVGSSVQDQLDEKIVGTGSSTDRAIAIWDGVDGDALTESSVVIDGSDNVTGINDLGIDGDLTATSVIAPTGYFGPGTSIVDQAVGIFGDSSDDARLRLRVGNDTNVQTPEIRFDRARGTSATPTVVSNQDYLGQLEFYGYTGSAYDDSVVITAFVDGSPGAGVPGGLAFGVTNTGGTSTTNRLYIRSNGDLQCTGPEILAAGTGSGTGIVAFGDASGVGTNKISMRAPSSFSSYTLTLPTSAGPTGYYLGNSGSGALDWYQPPTITFDNAWTPTGSWSTNTTYNGTYHQMSKFFYGYGHVLLSGAPTSAPLTINLPSITVDEASLALASGVGVKTIGSVFIRDDSGTARVVGYVIYELGASSYVTITYFGQAAGASSIVDRGVTPVTQAAPFTFAANDTIEFSIGPLPISGWF